jgi:hypothetical protein
MPYSEARDINSICISHYLFLLYYYYQLANSLHFSSISLLINLYEVNQDILSFSSTFKPEFLTQCLARPLKDFRPASNIYKRARA